MRYRRIDRGLFAFVQRALWEQLGLEAVQLKADVVGQCDDLAALEIKVGLARRPEAIEGQVEVVQVDLERSPGRAQI